MAHLSEEPTAEQIQELARQTYEAIRKREHAWTRWLSSQNDLDRVIHECVTLTREIDPAGFSEPTFVEVTDSLGRVIDALERYFTEHVTATDVAQCHFLSHSLQSLKESKWWLVQGYSPNPSKRPTEDESRANAEQRASERLKSLFA